MIAGVFSGQGSQKVGMGQDLCNASLAARQVYEEAADRLGLDLLQLDESQMAQTRFAQLAIVTHSLAAWKAFLAKVESKPDVAFAGFSLGEYSALGAAGILSLPDLLALVNERAHLMQEASENNPGAMFAILGLDDEKLLGIVGQSQFIDRVWAVNFNCPGQIVIAGRVNETTACADELKAAGARRVVRLNVSGAFHTPLMSSAAARINDFSRKLTFHEPSGLFFSNRTASPIEAGCDWPSYLADHLCSPVRWSEEINAMQQHGCSAFFEFGQGKVLAGLIKKILPGSPIFPIEDSKTLDEASSAMIVDQL